MYSFSRVAGNVDMGIRGMDRIGGTLLVLLLLAANAFAQDAYEPDSQHNQAKPIVPGEIQTHSLEPDGDVDFVSFTLTEESRVQLTALVVQGGSNTFVHLYDSNWVEIGGGDFDQMIAILPAGNYFGEVSEQLKSKLIEEYVLTLAVVPAKPDAYEDDDTPEQAKAIAVGQNQKGHNIAPIGDEDWYTFTLIETTRVVVHVPTSLGSTLISLFTESDTIDPFNSGNSRIIDSLTAGTYFIRVDIPSGDDISGEYPIYVWTEGGPDPYEDDDTPSTASFIGTQSPKQTHNFDHQGDEDWVRFFANAGTTCEVQYQALGDQVDIHAALFKDGGTELIQEGDSVFTFVPEEDAFFVVRFTNNINWASAVDTIYTCGIPQQPPGIIPGTIVGFVTSTAKGPAIENAQIDVTDFGGLDATTDDRGIYTFPGLPPGTYTLQASAPGHLASLPTLVQLGSGSTEQSFELEALPPADIDADGNIDAVDVQLVINGALGIDIGGLDADVDDNSDVDAVDVQLVINAALARK
jgi:hypothetical protein